MPDPTNTAAPADAGQTNSAADPAATTGGGADATPRLTAAPPSSDRYSLGAEIARGGMGVVYRATDTILAREVAVKVLQDKYAPDSGAARRFAEEARITGQLQHPNIPAIHDLGVLTDGRSFLAMKLIKGDTFDELLAARLDPSVDRGRFVAAFEKVCEAVGYAHAHGVIHRDLKPANIMVGAFGEVQVMDWGLAKVLGSRPDPVADPDATVGGTEILSLRESDGSFTHAGSVLGTPAFMPPEQAVGAVGKIDARSDVFGLGAVLAVILTGDPPFAAHSAETTRVKAAQGDVADCFNRLDGCGADPELVALCKQCLAPRRDDRPADGGAVAAAVAALRTAADERARLAELRRVKAEGEKVAVEVRTAERRKRRQLVIGAVGVLVTAVIGGLSAVLAVQDKARRELETTNAQLEAEKAEVVLQANTTADRVRFLMRDQVVMLNRLGLNEQRVALTEFVVKDLERLVNATGKNEGVRDRVRLAALVTLGNHYQSEATRTNSPTLRSQLLERAQKEFEAAVELAEQVVRASPDNDQARSNLAVALTSRGSFALAAGRREVAARDIEAGLQLRREIVDSPKTPPGAHGHTYPADAWAALAESYVSKSSLASRPSQDAEYWSLMRQAVDAREKALALAETGSATGNPWTESPEGLSGFQRGLAGLYYNYSRSLTSEPQAALEFARKMVALLERVTADNPTSIPDRLDLAISHGWFGDLCLFLGKPKEAIEPYKSSFTHLAQATGSTDIRGRWAMAYYRVGTAQRMTGQRVEARANYQRCLLIREDLAQGKQEVGSQINLMIAQAAVGQPELAVTTANEILAKYPTTVTIVFNVGATYALAAESVGDGAATTELTAEQKKQRAVYLTEAWTYVERLAKAKSVRFNEVAVDPDFDYLRMQPDFTARYAALRQKYP